MKTDITKEIAKQIKRFKDHPNFPAEDGQKELTKAFREECVTAEMVQAVGDQVMRTVKFAPVPSDVYTAADVVREKRTASGGTQEEFGARPGDTPFSGIQELITPELRELIENKSKRHPLSVAGAVNAR